MAVLSKRANKQQREWIKKYERDTGFEVMHQEDYDEGKIGWQELVRDNLAWYELHTQEMHRYLERNAPYMWRR